MRIISLPAFRKVFKYMIRPYNVLTAAWLILLSVSAIAQNAEVLLVPESLRTQRSVCGADMDAGSILSISSLGAQSNSIDSDPIVLCYGDQIYINHAGDADFNGDPNMATNPGVGYAFYSCPPTVTGQERDNITAMDACLVDIPVPAEGFWVARGNLEGDIVFHNNGQIQEQFFGGAAGQMWFAPITITNFDATPPTFDDGSCLNVRIDEAFAVIYLNEISLVNFSTPDNMSLSGMFTLAGGYSEFDGSNYTVSLTKLDDPSVTGIVDALIAHDGTTTFTVPEAGLYTLRVTDATGCTTEFIVSVPNQDPVSLCISDTAVMPETNFCIPITVGDFNNILSVAFTIGWDPSVIEFLSVSNVHPTLGGNAGHDDTRGAEGLLTFLFFELSLNTISLPDSAVLFDVCFTAVGPPGSRSEIRFINDPTNINVTDDNDDLAVIIKHGSVIISNPTNPTLVYAACANGTGGVDLQLQVYGGNDPYIYDLNVSSSGADFDDGAISGGAPTILVDVPKDVYDIVITDGAGVMTFASIDLTVDQITVDTLTFDPTCMGGDDGRIEVLAINGGDGDYTTTWFGPGFTRYGTLVLDDLISGSYRLLVMDGNGCADTTRFELQDGLLEVMEVAKTLPECRGDRTGSITMEVVGNPPGDFSWTWTGPDGNPRTFMATSPMTFNNLQAGDYYLTLSNGLCTVEDTISLGASKNMQIQVDSISKPSCSGTNDAYIGISVLIDLNKVGPVFAWSTDPQTVVTTMDTTSIATMVRPGMHSVTITDGTCSIDTTFIVADPQPLQLITQDLQRFISQPSCPAGQNGRIDLGFAESVIGGTPFDPPRASYIFRWYDVGEGRDSFISRTSSIMGLPDGEFSVYVEDANGCSDSTVFTMASGPSIFTVLDQANVCRGDSVAQLTVSGDLTGNSILWSTGATSETISNLKEGTYTVSVTQTSAMGNCTVVDSVQIMDPVIDVAIIRPMQFSPRSNCNEPDSGIIFNHMTNYSGPTNYIWTSLNDTLTSGPFISVSQNGIYTFEVRDRVTGCIIYDSLVNVQFPEKISVMVDTTNVSCNGDADGMVLVTASGRGGLFDFAWSTGTSEMATGSSSIQNLTPGTYDVLVTESSDTACTVPLTFEIREPEVLTLSIDSTLTQDIRCFGDSDGQIGLIWEGGNQDAAPTIVWSSGGASNTLSAANLSAGTYDIVLTDSKGCTGMISHTIIEPAALQGNVPAPAEPICSGFQTVITVNNVSGGTGSDYAFSVDNGPTQSLDSEVPVFAGDHLVTIFDNRGCKLDTMIFISEPSAIDVDLGMDLSVALGDSVQINPEVSGPSPVDTYIWTPVESLSCMNCADPFAHPFETQQYELTVIDVNGCEGTDEILIQVDKARLVFIPNGFTPNNDGINDLWQVYSGPGVRRILGIRVFDRWGNIVFGNDNEEFVSRDFPSSGWDGRYDGT
ncbi:MAG: hypothetical protein HKN76_03240, partial [Saprospiraceae bacterium]|nr:hypothetical protein [Saprospiraceae bacterium]